MELFIVVINSYVHIAMYFYYLLCAFKSCAKLTNFIKPLVTMVQIAQLVLMLGHCFVAMMPGCNATKLFYLQAPNILLLIFFFARFYLNSYSKEGGKEK